MLNSEQAQETLKMLRMCKEGHLCAGSGSDITGVSPALTCDHVILVEILWHFYEPTNSGPQASLGKTADLYSTHIYLSPPHLYYRVFLPESNTFRGFFFFLNIGLTLPAMIKIPSLVILHDGLVTCGVPTQVSHIFKRWQDFVILVLKYKPALHARTAAAGITGTQYEHGGASE